MVLRRVVLTLINPERAMKISLVFPIAAILAILAISGCANTIRGMGADTANTVNATQSAGHRVARSTN